MPERPRTCKSCLYTTDHPLGLTVNESGVCSGCEVHREKYDLDWSYRWRLLEEIVAPYRSRSGSHDCIVPVTGGGDSFFTLHMVKNRLGLNPLGIHYNSQLNTRLGMRNLARLRDVFDLDILSFTARPDSVRRVVTESMVRLGSVWWHVVAGQSALAAQVAVKRGIPLVIWGAHQGIEQVGMFSHLTAPEMTRRYRREHDLMGLEIEDLSAGYSGIRSEDQAAFSYPSDADLLKIGIRGLYLSNYHPWDPISQNHMMERDFGYRGTIVPRSFDVYEHVDSIAYLGIHDVLKFAKHGFSKITDQAVREIRHGRMSRDQAQRIVRPVTSHDIPWVNEFSDWLGASPQAIKLLLGKLGKFSELLSFSHGLDRPAVHSSSGVDDFAELTFLNRSQYVADKAEWLQGPVTYHRGFPYEL
jgi:N-acetyl sugar amidotransferase